MIEKWIRDSILKNIIALRYCLENTYERNDCILIYHLRNSLNLYHLYNKTEIIKNDKN